MSEDLFLIPSIINTGNAPWSYTTVRSVFSADDRFLQTLESITSIRQRMPNAKILLVECSPLTHQQKEVLQTRTDYFLDLSEDPEAIACCITTEKKGLGEAYQTKRAADFIREKNLQFRRLFKLSGRYSLNEEFVETNYSDTVFTFKRRVAQAIPSHSTVIYSLPYALFPHYYECLCLSVNFYLSGQNRGWEEVLPPILEPKQELDRMGAQGLVAVNGDFFTC
jgi:hypothetical protein